MNKVERELVRLALLDDMNEKIDLIMEHLGIALEEVEDEESE